MVARRRDIMKLAEVDPAGLRNTLLETIANSFKVEAGNPSDVSVALFGREAEQGMRLLQILDRKYAVVVTNPPYLGSRYMNAFLRKFIENHYPSGKRDLYAAFILRCLELCTPNGRVAMVTMQSWMFFKSFINLRSIPSKHLGVAQSTHEFTGLLRETNIEAVAHLGSYAFEEIVGEVVRRVMFVLANCSLLDSHQIASFRLTGLKNSIEKAQALNQRQVTRNSNFRYNPHQKEILNIPNTPIVYWLGEKIFNLLSFPSTRFSDVVTIRYGMNTGDNNRFLRYFWEILHQKERWVQYAKGGGYMKWVGLEWFVLDWRKSGIALRSTKEAAIRNPQYYFRKGITYSRMAQGALGTRYLPKKAAFDSASLSMFPLDYKNINLEKVLAVSNSRLTSYILRVISSDIEFNPGYVDQAPFVLPFESNIIQIIDFIVQLKYLLITNECIEYNFESASSLPIGILQTILHTLEGLNEQVVSDAYKLDGISLQVILDETGTPAGWYPLIAG